MVAIEYGRGGEKEPKKVGRRILPGSMSCRCHVHVMSMSCSCHVMSCPCVHRYSFATIGGPSSLIQQLTSPLGRVGPRVTMSVCLDVCAIVCSFFLGVSLALRSHDQFQASHFSTPPPPHSHSVGRFCLECQCGGPAGKVVWIFIYCSNIHPSILGRPRSCEWTDERPGSCPELFYPLFYYFTRIVPKPMMPCPKYYCTVSSTKTHP